MNLAKNALPWTIRIAHVLTGGMLSAPGHAGIDPSDGYYLRWRERFPHTRGDRSTPATIRSIPAAVPPHTRGQIGFPIPHNSTIRKDRVT